MLSLTTVAIGAVIAFSSLIIGVLIIVHFIRRRNKLRPTRHLPDLIKEHFKDALTSVLYSTHESSPDLFYKEITIDSGYEWDRFNNIFYDILAGGSLKPKKVVAVCPKNLLSSFSHHRNNVVNRLKDNKALFQKLEWKKHDADGRRAWIRSVFDQKISILNSEGDLAPVMIAAHGTSFEVAWKICRNGFTAIPNISDAGWYGKGIYFTTTLTYCLPYFKGTPTVVIACVMPGNPYPVIEGRNDTVNFNGAALKQGCQCHYVLTTKDGIPCPNQTEIFYDELVVEQESQVVPMYVVEINNENFAQIMRDMHSSPSGFKVVQLDQPKEDEYYAMGDGMDQKNKS